MKVTRKSNSESRQTTMIRVAIIAGILVILALVSVYVSALSAALHADGPQSPQLSQAQASVAPKIQLRKVEDLAGAAVGGAHVKSIQTSSAQLLTKHSTNDSRQETLVLTTKLGDMRILLRPDLSKESVDYVKQIVKGETCLNCRFYRAEKPGILQGILKGPPELPVSSVKGSCPPGYESVSNECPEWDSSCACHGPTMTRGMVGWAAGATGPDFFVDAYLQPATWWGTQHTVWGQITDTATLDIIQTIWTLPTNQDGGLTFLNEPLQFDKIALETGTA